MTPAMAQAIQANMAAQTAQQNPNGMGPLQAGGGIPPGWQAALSRIAQSGLNAPPGTGIGAPNAQAGVGPLSPQGGTMPGAPQRQWAPATIDGVPLNSFMSNQAAMQAANPGVNIAANLAAGPGTAQSGIAPGTGALSPQAMNRARSILRGR